MRPFVALAVLMLVLPLAASAQYAFTWEPRAQGAAADLLQLTVFHSDVVNTGTLPGQYRVTMSVDAPANWVTSMCEGDYCYAPFIRTFDFSLSPGDTNDIGANITPVIDLGGALVGITIASLDDPSLSITHAFTLVTAGFDVLVVDADPAGDPAPLTAAALGAAGKSSLVWRADLVGSPDASVLGRYDAVVWSTGAALTALDDDARTALDAYATGGGHVWLDGAKLAFSQCFSGSPAYTPEGRAWFNLVAGVDWAAALAVPAAVTGVPGDEWGDGLAVSLGGGDGADNNLSPDALAATGGGVAALVYPGGQTAGVRRVWGAGRLATTGFTLEGVGTAADRAALAAAVFDWFVSGVSAAPDAPALVGAPTATPNPFNPRTVIAFSVDGSLSRPVTVTVHDLRGRVVRSLLSADLGPGPQAVAWDGRDDAGRAVAGGLYLARVRAGRDEAVVKMTLAK